MEELPVLLHERFALDAQRQGIFGHSMGGHGALVVALRNPERLREACASAGVPLELRLQPGYGHSYYFIASFVGDHVAHHARALRA